MYISDRVNSSENNKLKKCSHKYVKTIIKPPTTYCQKLSNISSELKRPLLFEIGKFVLLVALSRGYCRCTCDEDAPFTSAYRKCSVDATFDLRPQCNISYLLYLDTRIIASNQTSQSLLEIILLMSNERPSGMSLCETRIFMNTYSEWTMILFCICVGNWYCIIVILRWNM